MTTLEQEIVHISKKIEIDRGHPIFEGHSRLLTSFDMIFFVSLNAHIYIAFVEQRRAIVWFKG